MGSCLSSDSADCVSSSALVISPSGDLRPYSTPVLVSDVMDSSSFFVCNSDNLSYDEHITAMNPKDELDAGQIYFVLPVSKLRHRLSASEMAALAVKASLALNSTSRHNNNNNSSIMGMGMGGRKNKSKISPFVVMESTSKINSHVMENKRQQLGVSRSGSIRKMHTRKAPLGVPSFRLRLSTIYEA